MTETKQGGDRANTGLEAACLCGQSSLRTRRGRGTSCGLKTPIGPGADRSGADWSGADWWRLWGVGWRSVAISALVPIVVVCLALWLGVGYGVASGSVAWAQDGATPDEETDPAAERPVLGLPIACALETDCWVTSYVDTDPGPGIADSQCGRLTYDGHKGTDIGVGILTAGREIPVLAAADGLVLRVRDSMPDVSTRSPAAIDVAGKECGNGVVIDHGNGWETQYCHLRRDSLRVTPGQPVTAGTVLGLVGLSGLTEHPHVHMAVRHDGVVVDPFTGKAAADGCRTTQTPLWEPALTDRFVYHPVLLYNVGFAGEEPDRNKVRSARFEEGVIPATAPVLVVFVDMLGVAQGDRLRLTITDPLGEVFATSDQVFEDKGWIQWFGFVGKRRQAGAWMGGRYTARVTVERPTVGVIADRQTEAWVEEEK